MKKNVILLGALVLSSFVYSQVGIDTDTPKATLEIKASPTSTTKIDGLIAPRLTGQQLKSNDSKYTSDQNAAIVYVTQALTSANTSSKTANVTSIGYYYFDSNLDNSNGQWVKLRSGYDAAGTEPWYNQTDASQATANTQNIYQNGSVAIKKSTGFISGADLDVKGSIRGGNAKIMANSSTPVVVGTNSFAFGQNSSAIGTNSTGIGYNSTANSDNSNAIGYNNTTNSTNSFAIGLNTKTGYDVDGTTSKSAINSFAIGENAITGGESAYSIGRQTKSTGYRSFSFGNGSIATSANSYAIGFSSKAGFDLDGTTSKDASNSFAIGYESITGGNAAFAIGRSAKAMGSQAFSLGTQTISTSDYSFAIGIGSKTGYDIDGTTAKDARNSFAIGDGAVTGGYRAYAIGKSLTSRQDSYGIGFANKTSGGNSYSFGQENTNSGNSSYAIGKSNTISGNNSVAFGASNTTSSTSTYIIGSQNIINANNNTIIGNNIKHDESTTTASENTALGRTLVIDGKNSMVFGYGIRLKPTAFQTLAAGSSLWAQGTYQTILGHNLQSDPDVIGQTLLGWQPLSNVVAIGANSNIATSLANNPIMFSVGNSESTTTSTVIPRSVITTRKDGYTIIGNLRGINGANNLAKIDPVNDELFKVLGGIYAEGNIRAQGSVFMNTTTSIPDYVFQKYYTGTSDLNSNYTFSSNIFEVEKFLKKNHHLPGVMSAKEIYNTQTKSYDIDMGALQNQTLEKVEELYLYTIEQQKQIDELKELVKTQQSQINQLLSK